VCSVCVFEGRNEVAAFSFFFPSSPGNPSSLTSHLSLLSHTQQTQKQVTDGAPADKPDLTLTIADADFVKLVMGKMGPQQVRGRGGLCERG
jgi:hypothetical protein